MAGEVDTSFTSLCSSLSLQTDKKGFFLPYADNVSETVGNKWIENVFGKLKTNEERIKMLVSDPKVREVANGPLDALQLQWRRKDPAAASQARKEGARALEEDKLRAALQLFSQAVIRAPPAPKNTAEGSEAAGEMALALVARAEALERLREFALALRDLRAADRIRYQAIPRFQVLWRMARCHRGLGQPRRACVALRAAQALLAALQADANGDKRLAHAARILADDLSAAEDAVADTAVDAPDPLEHPDEWKPTLSGGAGQLAGAASGVGVSSTADAGRFLEAQRLFNAGETVVTESPLAACLLPENFSSHCHHCMRNLKAPVACQRCAGLAFCGEACAREAAVYHSVECRLGDVLLASGMSILCRIALRLATQAPGRAAVFIDNLEDQPERVAYVAQLRCLEELVTHAGTRPASDMLQRALMSLFLLKMLRKADFFKGDASPAPGEPLGKAELRVGARLLLWLQLLQFNAHEIYETRMAAKGRFRGAKPSYIGVAIYPTAALCNHDCYPALARFFVGTTLVLQTLRPLLPGEALAENYGPAFVKFPLAKRKRSLLSRYWFNCMCTACREDWPTFEEMDNSFHVRCPTRGCRKRHLLKQDIIESSNPNKKNIKCSECRKGVNVSDILLSIQDAEKEYLEGLEHMEKGNATAAVPFFCSYVNRMHRIGHPPKKNLHLCQEALRICLADAGNKWIASEIEK